MREFMEKLKEKLRQGNGEIIMYAAVLVPLFILLIGCAGILQITGAYGELNKAVVTAGRAASICKEETDAQDQVQRVASSCITVPTIKNLNTSIEMVDGDWGAGSIAKVTVEGDVDTIAPFLLNGHYSRSTLVTIEGGGKNYGLWRLTAYCSCPICQGPWHGTASGAPLTPGRTIAIAKSTCDALGLKFGDRFMINGHVYTLEDYGDTNMAVSNNGLCIDIFFPSHAEASNFGLQYAQVFKVS